MTPQISIDAQQVLNQMNIQLVPRTIQPNVAISSTQADATAVAQFPGATVCAHFLAEYSDLNTSNPTPRLVWVVSLQPSEPLTSTGPPGSRSVAMTFLYALTDPSTGDFLQAYAGAPDA